jgi:aryl carrier-like protein
MPLTPDDKLGRDALTVPESRSVDAVQVPRTTREQLLCQLFAEVLDVPTVGPNDDFFELGGHSMIATRLVARIRALGAELELRALFDTPTPAELVTCLQMHDQPNQLDVISPLKNQAATLRCSAYTHENLER